MCVGTVCRGTMDQAIIYEITVFDLRFMTVLLNNKTLSLRIKSGRAKKTISCHLIPAVVFCCSKGLSAILSFDKLDMV